MAGMPTGGHALGKPEAQAKVMRLLSTGSTVEAAMEKVGRSIKTWEAWKKQDSEFKTRVEIILATRKQSSSGREDKRAAAREMGFAAWRMEYLGLPTYRHQLQWIDLIEGNDPRDLHESQTYEPGRRNRIVMNTAPFHAKSMTLSIDYLTYRICLDPGVRTIIISKTQTLAKQFLGAIKQRLSHPRYAELIKDFGPAGGFMATAEKWSEDAITLAVDDRDGVEKDPTVQAIGLGGQVYGTRADLILVDDAVTLSNANEWEKQMSWLIQEVGTRPGPSGKIVVVGTRVSANDLYYQLRNPDNYSSGKSPWTYLSQPAILEEASDPKDWKTLWPRASESWWTEDDECDCGIPECQTGYDDGSFPRWDGVHLKALRDSQDNRRWQLVFMQAEVGGDATFPAYAIQDSIDKARRYGKDGGMHSVPPDCYVIGSMDPAVSGFAGALVMAVDRRSHKRYVLDVANLKHPTPRELKNLIKAWTNEYGIHEWVVEKDGLLQMFNQDDELRDWIHARGVRWTSHLTRGSKFDVEYGVSSMAPLFGTYQEFEDGDRKRLTAPLISLPRANDSDDLRALVHQLTIWTPELDPKRTPCDLVMALWFAEIGARKLVKAGQRPVGAWASKRPFLSAREKKARVVIDLSERRTWGVA